MRGMQIEMKVLSALKEEALSAPVVAMLIEVDTEVARAELDRLYWSSKVEVRPGDEPLYRLA